MATREAICQVMTACRLVDGHVVYLDKDGAWSEWIEEASVATSQPEADDLTAKAKAAEASNEVFETYLVDVTVNKGAIRPIKMREVIRADGPTVHPQFGKQAERRKSGV